MRRPSLQTGPAGATPLRLLIAAALLVLLSRPAPKLLRTHRRLPLPCGAVFAVMRLPFCEATSRLPPGVVVTLEFSGPMLLTALTSRRGSERLRVGPRGTGLLVLGGTQGRPFRRPPPRGDDGCGSQVRSGHLPFPEAGRTRGDRAARRRRGAGHRTAGG
ncbi:hypothetical protein [Streptomyces lateritius]|uniref:hypothetical protein n=1 Tax=Streptomyces lateritius TaxID=67313 RepID=UPI001677FBF1|nr:hypothetical protein [Streptomyces lateritius]GGT99588.1 hypothetical protein GCM10010272_50540 [Streptomyces lateritius]